MLVTMSGRFGFKSWLFCYLVTLGKFFSYFKCRYCTFIMIKWECNVLSMSIVHGICSYLCCYCFNELSVALINQSYVCLPLWSGPWAYSWFCCFSFLFLHLCLFRECVCMCASVYMYAHVFVLAQESTGRSQYLQSRS